MQLICDEAVDRMHRDHDYMLDLIRRIKASCDRSDKIANCRDCGSNHREFCHSNIEQLVRAFVEATLKHNAIESLYMAKNVPKTHRIAHNNAHLAIAEQLRAIRVVFSEDGNCVQAIHGIDEVLQTLQSHFQEFDRHLESYLTAHA
jgi:hemerythrin